MEDSGFSAFNKKELALLAKTLGNMGDAAIAEARTTSHALADFASSEIKQAGYGRQVSAKAVRRIVDGMRVSKTSKTGQISIGFAGQRFSGGATTQMLWAGNEFGSNKFKQFPRWSGRYGRGSRGWFIYPTLRGIQPELTRRWTAMAERIIKGWAN